MIKKFSIIKRAYIRLTVGGLLLIGAWTLFFMNIRLSEEFTGGVKITIAATVDEQKLNDSLTKYLIDQKYPNSNVLVQINDEETDISIRTRVENDEKVNELSKELKTFLLEGEYITSQDQVIAQTITGPSVGDYMKTSARNALLVGLALMAIYMLFSFAAIRKSVSPSILAIVTIVTMIFDVSIPAGAFGFLMMIDHSIAIDSVFIIAILANMGYSINDTIIVFDRIRENIQNKNEKNIVYGKLFDDSVRQTMRRSFGTVFSTFLVIVCMYIFGTGAVKDFAFTIGIGVIAGSYSSIFISAPLAYIMMGKYKKERKAMSEIN
ncbi:Protein translocase subunit secF [candidate division SR1 bacterium RAAC1_SR1_1]|nr:Protein translocase subunit secF [candidate division SR1 bacterium RAAC1_SR1_1]